MKHFNNAGPSVDSMHYMIDPLVRIDVDSIESLVEQQRYFVLHAPRQTGKTTCLLALMHHFNAQGRYRALYVNIEAAQAARGNVEEGVAGMCSAFIRTAALYLKDQAVGDWYRTEGRQLTATDQISSLLAHWSAHDPQQPDAPRPTVLFLDEVDALVGDTLISLLRQIRAGYAQRPGAFPQSIILCGVRDVRDYRIHTAHQEIITGGSAFNIKAESLRLGNFSREETLALWQQHAAETGQAIDPAIWPELWADTEGQPWLVNALGYECTWRDKPARDRATPITLERYKAARERLIYSRTTHLDALSDKLTEPRVARIVAEVLASQDGAGLEERFPIDDVQYVEDLGLIHARPQVRIANRIYREVIPRELTWTTQIRITHDQAWYLTPERRLDVPKLLAAFQQFFREHADAWMEGFSFKEAGPQLLLQAFLQRIVNGGGRISREYGLGRKRTDLYIEWPVNEEHGFLGEVQRIVLELKLWKKGSLDAVLAEGQPQTVGYARQCGAEQAHLIVFDRRAKPAPWDKRIWQRRSTHDGWALGLWGA
jgi:AAA-like domain